MIKEKTILRNLAWIEDLLPPELQPISKRGGVGYFREMNLVLVLVEHEGTQYEHKGVPYPFDLWKGCIFPVEKSRQNAFFLKYIFLENHPANKNWLFIPADSENFEEEVKQMLVEIAKQNPLLGIELKQKNTASNKTDGAKMKTAGKKIKADKKRENAFLLSMIKKR